jgi:hypothetical protein
MIIVDKMTFFAFKSKNNDMFDYFAIIPLTGTLRLPPIEDPVKSRFSLPPTSNE